MQFSNFSRTHFKSNRKLKAHAVKLNFHNCNNDQKTENKDKWGIQPSSSLFYNFLLSQHPPPPTTHTCCPNKTALAKIPMIHQLVDSCLWQTKFWSSTFCPSLIHKIHKYDCWAWLVVYCVCTECRSLQGTQHYTQVVHNLINSKMFRKLHWADWQSFPVLRFLLITLKHSTHSLH